MDLTADKVLVAGVLIAMVEVELLPTWIVAVILIRELVIAGVRQVAASEDVVMAAGSLGKWKTIVTLVATAVLLLAFDARTDGPLAGLGLTDALLVVGFWLMVLAAAMTVLSGWAYLRAALPMLLGEDQAPPT
jgi:CDP-diacylglycerol--glycerol-3-phosphate 3-phosphatidyltransferase